MLQSDLRWKIVYYNEKLEDEILELPNTLLARYYQLARTIEEFGPFLRMPHTRAMGDGLFELRLKGKEGIARIIYCMVVKHEILLLHSFIKKQEVTPLHDLRVAKERYKEVLKNAKKNT